MDKRQQAIILMEQIMDPETRPMAIKMAMPYVQEGLGRFLENAVDGSVEEAKKECFTQFNAILSGQQQSEYKESINKVARAAVKGAVTSIVMGFFGDNKE